MLNFTRRALELRRDHPALRGGSLRIIEAGDQLLTFERREQGKGLRCTFNLSARPATFSSSGNVLINVGSIDGGVLGPYAALIEESE